jgi:hypothetical protein
MDPNPDTIPPGRGIWTDRTGAAGSFDAEPAGVTEGAERDEPLGDGSDADEPVDASVQATERPMRRTTSGIVVRFTALQGRSVLARSPSNETVTVHVWFPATAVGEQTKGSESERSGYYPDGAIRSRRKRWTIRR